MTPNPLDPWRVLVVDDEPDVHAVTKLALGNLTFKDRPVELTHACDGASARRLLADSRYAVALLDVVMESDNAGLALVQHIRDTLKEQQTRIIVRTGQPGTAPEWATVADYDIDGYVEKAQATAQRLRSATLTALRGYDQIGQLETANRALADHNDQLHALVETLAAFNQETDDKTRLQRLLDRLRSVAGDAPSIGVALVERRMQDDSQRSADWLMGTSGALTQTQPDRLRALPDAVRDGVARCFAVQRSVFETQQSFVYVTSSRLRPRVYCIVHPEGCDGTSDMLQLFCQSLTDATDAFELMGEVKAAQTEMVLVLSEAVEARSQETGNHVRRVGAYSRILADALGLPKSEGETLETAAPLHDIGKVSIPDSVLKKPGALDDEEWALMKTHADIGRNLLRQHPQPVMRAAAIVAGEHHEKWDGSGYPKGLRGDAIHIYGRITAVADVFDAISSNRVYKDAWPIDECRAHIRKLSGSHFDPAVVAAFEASIDDILAVREQLAD